MAKSQKLLFRKEWSNFIKEEFNDIPEIGYKVYCAIVDYFYDGIMPEDRMVKLAIGSIVKEIDADKVAYAERVEKNRENARKGGNPNFKKGQHNPYYNNTNEVIDVVISEDILPQNTMTPDQSTDITERICLDNQTDIKDNPIYSNVIELLHDNTNVSSFHNSSKKKNIEKKDGELSFEIDPTDTPEIAEPINPQTKTKVERVKSEDEIRFDEYMKSNYPRICKMSKPLTFEQYNKLVSDYGLDLTTDTLNSLENCAKLNQKYVSAYMTLNNWCKRDNRRNYGSNIKHNQTTQRPASFAESDLAAAIMANFSASNGSAL